MKKIKYNRLTNVVQTNVVQRLEENLLNSFQLNWTQPLSEVVPSFRPVLDPVHKPAYLELVQFQFQFQFNEPACLATCWNLANWATVNPAPTSTRWRMDGKWSWNGFLLSSSSVANQDCANPGTEPDQFYGTGAHLNQTRIGTGTRTGTKISIVVVVLLPFSTS
jgi:hypothetical protein